MKIVRHLPLLFLSILFVLVLPHFYNQALATTIDEFSSPTSNAGPAQITFGSDGNVWFTEINGNKIGRITPSGIITEFSIPTTNSLPTGITSGPDGNLWFAESNGNRIGRITPSGSITEFSTPTTGSHPAYITSGPDGNLWFTEQGSNKIGKITIGGSITEFSTPYDLPHQPYKITTGPDGNLWFNTYGGGGIARITTSGTVLTMFPVNSLIDGMTTGPDGNLWFAEPSGTLDPGKIGKMTASGTVTAEYTLSNSNSFPSGITSGPDGNFWFTEENGNRIGRITPSGTITEFSIPTTNSNPLSITFGWDGNFWFTEHDANQIGRVNANLSPRLPLIFIPGIMGSEFKVNQTFYPNINDCFIPALTYQYNQGDTVWEKIDYTNVISYSLCGKYLDVLKLQNDGQTPVNSQIGLKGTVIQSLYNDGTGNSTFGYLQTQGYTLGTNLFVFPYDWRKDISLTASQLNASISAVLTQTGASKVQIMAHSMGGLVAREYISDATRAQKVDTLVELGTPHAGAPQALADLLYPTCIHWVIDTNIATTSAHSRLLCAVNQNEVNSLVQNFTAAFELLPSKLYYNSLYPDLSPYKDVMDVAHDGLAGALNFDQTRKLLADLGKNTTASRSADLFHDSLDSSYATTSGVKTYLIAGSGIATPGQLFDYVWSTSGQLKHDAVATDGDGTVPTKSATLNQTSNVFYANTDHGGLVSSGSALLKAVNLLNGLTNSIPGIQTTPFAFSGKFIGVYSPTQLDAYDDQNNHTGKNSDGTYEQTIPGSEYYELGDAKFIYLPSGGHYNIKTKATAAGSFDLKMKNYTSSQIDNQTIFLNVSQTASTTASMDPAATNPVLTVDVNGDGTNVQQVSPNYTLTGNSATDSAAPVTTAALSPNPNANGTYSNPVTVTLTATPTAGFSVTNTYYTIDGGSQQTYTSAFTVSGVASHTITYWSVDNAGLTEAQNTKTFVIGSNIPALVQKNFQSQHTSSNALAFTSNVTAGNTILVAITQWNTTVSSVTDNRGNTYTAVTPARHANTSTDYAELYYAKNVAGGATTVTVAFSGTADTNVGIYEYSGLDPISPLEQLASNTGFGSAPNGGTVTTATDNELYFAVGVDDNGNNVAPTAGSGYTLENHQDDSTSHERFYSEDRISAHGSYSTNFTIGTSSNWAVIGASFKPAGSSISMRAASSGNNAGGGTTLVINKPAGTASGDVMIAHVVVQTAGNTITAPSGWALIRRQDSGSSVSRYKDSTGVMERTERRATSVGAREVEWGAFTSRFLRNGGIAQKGALA